MIQPFIIIYTFVIALNSVNKISSWAALDTNWRRNSLAAGGLPTAATAFAGDDDYETWQPAVQSQNWLITTAGTAPLSLKSAQHRERERFSLMMQRQEPHQRQQYLPNSYYVYNHNNRTYTKKQIAPLSSVSFTSNSNSNSAFPSTSTSYEGTPTATIKLKPYVVTSKDANTNAYVNANANTKANANDNYRRYNPKKHHLVEHPYAPHIPKDTVGTASQAERRMDANKHFMTDVNHPSQLPYQDNLLSPAMIDSRLSHISATATTKDTFTVTNVKLIDTAAAPTFNNADEENIKAILLPLHAALDKVKHFCDIVKDIITDDKDSDDNGVDGGIDDVTEDAAAGDEDLSNEDANNDNDLTNSNLAPVLAAVKLLLMKQPTTSSSYSLPTPMGEVQGHMREMDEGMLEESLAPMPSTPLPPSTSPLPPTAPLVSHPLPLPPSPSESATSRAFTAHKASSRAAPAESPRLRRVPAVGSKRKIKKKIKKKLEKFLFPLLVAYKLKFLALVPLLIGGLTLLVGSTGLAGFFFALFAAVMTMKSGHGHRRSIFV